MNSCLYEGTVRHRRFQPHAHTFEYRIFWVCLDLAELGEVFRGRWLWSIGRPNLAWLRRADHFGDAKDSLADSAARLLEERTGQRPSGGIRLLTHLRYWGYCFNPVSFFYALHEQGETQAIIAEVNNTPWGERHCYVLPRENNGLHFRFSKVFHVSPFMPMHHTYDWRFSELGERLTIHMENFDGESLIFDSTTTMQRRPITGWNLARALIIYPCLTVRVILAIHWQALRLWLKRTPVFDHPSKRIVTG